MYLHFGWLVTPGTGFSCGGYILRKDMHRNQKGSRMVIQEFFHKNQTWGDWDYKSGKKRIREGGNMKAKFSNLSVFHITFFLFSQYILRYPYISLLLLTIDSSRSNSASPSPDNLPGVPFPFLSLPRAED